MHGSTEKRNRDAGRDERDGREERHQRHEDQPGRGESRTSRHDGNGHTHRPRPKAGLAIVERAKAHLSELIGRPSEGVSSMTRTRDGWRVVVEVVELERIPRTTDILASYLVELDEDGELMSYQRLNRYYRNDVSTNS